MLVVLLMTRLEVEDGERKWGGDEHEISHPVHLCPSIGLFPQEASSMSAEVGAVVHRPHVHCTCEA